MPHVVTNVQPVEWEAEQVYSEESGEKHDIIIRALNPDNLREVEEVVDLFTRDYGMSYPFKHVYDPSFWYSKQDEASEQENLISIVAVDDRRFVAHMGLRHEPGTGRIEMQLPAIHPAYRKQVFHMSRLFWRCILEQGKRQNWRLIYHHSLLAYPISQVVASKCFHSDTVAILPNSTPASKYRLLGVKKRTGRASLLINYNVLNERRVTPRVLHVPQHHAGMIEEIYQPLKLYRIFKTTQGAEQAVEPGETSGYEHGLSATVNESLNLQNLSIVPSELRTRDEGLERVFELGREDKNQLFVHVALTDPGCPKFCNTLESNGFRFCGVLPEAPAGDFIIFGKFENTDIKDVALYSPKAKALRNYMLTADRGRKFH